MTHAENSPGGLANHRKSFREEIVEGCALFETLAEFRRLGREFLVAQAEQAAFQGVDLVDQGLQSFQFAFVFTADYFFQ
jgi:hypothetical protein